MIRFMKALLLAGMLPLTAEGVAQESPSAAVELPNSTSDAPVTPQEPKPELERPTMWGEPTEVDIRLFVIDVDEVNSANQNFSASVYYQATWQIPSLVHKGPGPLNRALSEVWNPRLAIVNMQQAWNAYPAFVEISPEGEVVHRQKVWGWFSQPLDLRDFPMDDQTLTIHIAAAGHLEKDVRITSSEREYGRRSGIASRFSIPDFEVVSWKAEPNVVDPENWTA